VEDPECPNARLTAREKQVLALLADGSGNRTIARALVISPQTARTHVPNVLGKLGLHSLLEAAAFQTLAKRLELEDRVRFLGRIPRERLLQTMREDADVLLFPSLREEAGWVVAEAVASGLPVVCLDQGGPPLLAAGVFLLPRSSMTAVSLALAVDHLFPADRPGFPGYLRQTAGEAMAAHCSTGRVGRIGAGMRHRGQPLCSSRSRLMGPQAAA
jgi:DNA-binding CsgD family transcriptional regulator